MVARSPLPPPNPILNSPSPQPALPPPLSLPRCASCWCWPPRPAAWRAWRCRRSPPTWLPRWPPPSLRRRRTRARVGQVGASGKGFVSQCGMLGCVQLMWYWSLRWPKGSCCMAHAAGSRRLRPPHIYHSLTPSLPSTLLHRRGLRLHPRQAGQEGRQAWRQEGRRRRRLAGWLPAARAARRGHCGPGARVPGHEVGCWLGLLGAWAAQGRRKRRPVPVAFGELCACRVTSMNIEAKHCSAVMHR